MRQPPHGVPHTGIDWLHRKHTNTEASGDFPAVDHRLLPHPLKAGTDANFSVGFVHRLRFTRGVFDVENPLLTQLMIGPGGSPNGHGSLTSSPARALVFVDQGVLSHWPGLPDRLQRYTQAHADRMVLTGPVHPVVGGEPCKNDRGVFDGLCQAIHDAGLCRHSYVIAIGGGAVLDAVGFAAATAHRGVRFVRLPTTTLAQGDAGVGVKCAINAFGKKNFLGAFSPPWAVINDAPFLTTLSGRDWRCGFSEAVKVALIKDARLFDRIVAGSQAIRRRDLDIADPILRRSAQLHLEHVTQGGDPFERADARPLDFGHWSAHKLESMSGYRLRHGEAVAIGVALDTAYSAITGLMPWAQAQAVLDTLTSLGFVLFDDAMRDTDVLLDGLEEFRQHLGGVLTLTLLKGIGRPIEAHRINPDQMAQAIEHLARYATPPQPAVAQA